MSRHNKERRKWKCQGCAAKLWPELADAEAVREAHAQTGNRVVHVCGICKTCHYHENGALRKLTPAEMFVLHVDVPNTLAAIEQTTFEPSDTPAGVVYIGDE